MSVLCDKKYVMKAGYCKEKNTSRNIGISVVFIEPSDKRA